MVAMSARTKVERKVDLKVVLLVETTAVPKAASKAVG